MGRHVRFGGTTLLAAALTMVVSACTSPGDLSITNDSSDTVTVFTGNDSVEVAGYGGAILLGSGCTPGDVTVTFPSGQAIVLAGPVCPDQEIVVRDGTATLE